MLWAGTWVSDWWMFGGLSLLLGGLFWILCNFSLLPVQQDEEEIHLLAESLLTNLDRRGQGKRKEHGAWVSAFFADPVPWLGSWERDGVVILPHSSLPVLLALVSFCQGLLGCRSSLQDVVFSGLYWIQIFFPSCSILAFPWFSCLLWYSWLSLL